MFLSAKAFFKDNSASQILLVKQAETEIPAEFVRLYKKNVVGKTPMKTGALRRSIITQAIGSRAQIGWRSAYAGAQEAGQHAGSGPYKNYTTPGTGPHFARDAFSATSRDMVAVLNKYRIKG